MGVTRKIATVGISEFVRISDKSEGDIMLNRMTIPMVLLGVCVAGAGQILQGEEIFTLPKADPSASIPWDLTKLYQVPQTFPATNITEDVAPGITPLFYKGEDYFGKETRIFAWIGIPTNGAGPFPGMVLVHGGGGTAYKDWVKFWVDRGYAAIAMDTAGHIEIRPEGKTQGWQLHEHCGPRGWGGFDQLNNPTEDQWMYHAVAAVIRGNSLLCSFPQVDSSRIGITGISWGGILTCIAAGLDNRLSFAAPVYGCGFLGEDSFWLSEFMRPMGREKTMQWLNLWDPSRYVNRAAIPMLFVNGTNDKHFRLGSWQKTYREAKGNVTLACRVRMSHSDIAGRAPEVASFADSVFMSGAPLPEITEQGRTGQNVWIKYASQVPIQKAELNYTRDAGEWPQRVWYSTGIAVNSQGNSVSAELPPQTTAYFINLFDSRGLVSSSEHEEVLP